MHNVTLCYALAYGKRWEALHDGNTVNTGPSFSSNKIKMIHINFGSESKFTICLIFEPFDCPYPPHHVLIVMYLR